MLFRRRSKVESGNPRMSHGAGVLNPRMAMAVAVALAALSVLPARGQSKASGRDRRECVMLQSLDGSAPYVSDPVECAVKSAPASTFKIPHALIALETGVVANAHETVKWDGTRRPFKAWEQDHSLDSAIKSSVVWFFQRTAVLIGRDRMHDYLRALAYAEDTFDGELTTFWLNGDLEVSPVEQLDFLRREVRYELPIRREHVDAVNDALLMPPGQITNAAGAHDFTLTWPAPLTVRAKTGSTSVNGEWISWLVGYVASASRSYAFVSRVRAHEELAGTAAAALARRVLNAHAPVPGR
jgi:beta-lactamase class D